MSRILVICVILVGWARHWRRVIGVTLIAAMTAGMVFPPRAYAQLGVLSGIENILNIINGAMATALDTMNTVARSLETLHRQIVWPVPLIHRARSAIASLTAQFRGVMNSIYRTSVGSATLSTPAALDAILRNRQTNDFSSLTSSYYQAFGALPAADQVDPLARKLIDMDDGLALATLKTSKAADQAGDLVLCKISELLELIGKRAVVLGFASRSILSNDSSRYEIVTSAGP